MADEQSPNNEPPADLGGRAAESGRAAGTGEPTVEQAQPYRSPANISETTTTAGIKGSPWVWIAAMTCMGAVASAAVFYLRSPVEDFNLNRRPVVKSVEDFGSSRIPPPEDEDLDIIHPVTGPVVDTAVEGAAVESSEPVVP